MTTFNIGTQVGSVVNNIGGDQVIAGSQSGGEVGLVDLDRARSAVSELEKVLRSERAHRHVPHGVVAEVEGLAAEFAHEKPNKTSVAERLRQLMPALISASHVIGATTQVSSAVQTLIQWLGPVGNHLLAMLPTVL